MNLKVKQLVAGATITAALGVTATGMAAGAASAAPAAPPAISSQADHGGPHRRSVVVDRVDRRRRTSNADPVDRQPTTTGLTTTGASLRGRAEETSGGNGMVPRGARESRRGAGVPRPRRHGVDHPRRRGGRRHRHSTTGDTR